MIYSHTNNQPEIFNDSSNHQRLQSAIINERPLLNSHLPLNDPLAHPNIHFTNTRYIPYTQQNQSIVRTPQTVTTHVLPGHIQRGQTANNYISYRPQILNRETTLKKDFALRSQTIYQNPHASLISSPIKVFRAQGPPLPYQPSFTPLEPTVQKKYIIIDETEKVKEEMRLRPHVEGPIINQSIVKEFHDPERQAKKHLFESSGYRQKQKGTPCITALIGLLLLLGLLTGLFFLFRGINGANPQQNQVRASIDYKQKPTDTNTIASNIRNSKGQENLKKNENLKTEQINKSNPILGNNTATGEAKTSNNTDGNITSVVKGDEAKTSADLSSAPSSNLTEIKIQNKTQLQGVSSISNSSQTQNNTSSINNQGQKNTTQVTVNPKESITTNNTAVEQKNSSQISNITIKQQNISENSSSKTSNTSMNISTDSNKLVNKSSQITTNVTESTVLVPANKTSTTNTSAQKTNVTKVNSTSVDVNNNQSTTKSSENTNYTVISQNKKQANITFNFSTSEAKNSTLITTNTTIDNSQKPVNPILNSSSAINNNNLNYTQKELSKNTTQNDVVNTSLVQSKDTKIIQNTDTTSNIILKAYNLTSEQISKDTNLSKIDYFIKDQDSSSLGQNPSLNYATVKETGTDKSYELSYRNGGREYRYQAYINELGKPVIRSVRIIQQVFPLHHQLLRNIHEKNHKLRSSKIE